MGYIKYRCVVIQDDPGLCCRKRLFKFVIKQKLVELWSRSFREILKVEFSNRRGNFILATKFWQLDFVLASDELFFRSLSRFNQIAKKTENPSDFCTS